MKDFDAVSIPIIEDEYVKYCILQAPDGKDSSDFLAAISRQEEILTEMVSIMSANVCTTKNKKIKSICKNQISYKTKYISYYKNYLHEKLKLATQNASLKYASVVEHLVDILKQFKKQSIPLIIDEGKLKSDIINAQDNDPKVIKYRSKLQKINSIYGHLKSTIYATPTFDQIQQLIYTAGSKVDEKNKYSPPSEFDNYIEYVISVNGLSKEYINALEASKKKGGVVISSAKPLTRRLHEIYRPRTVLERMVIVFAVSRQLSNDLYTQIECPLLKPNKEDFVKKCEKLRTLTPRELKITGGLLMEDIMDCPVQQLIAQRQDLREAVVSVRAAQFYPAAVDVAARLNDAIVAVHQFVLMNDYVQTTRHADFMCFDDLFSLFYFVLAASIPACAEGVAEFMTRNSGAGLSSAHEFATMVYQSSVDYINSLDLAKLEAGIIDDPEQLN